MKFILGFVACVVATAAVLVAVHGPTQLTVNPGAVAVVLGGIAIGLCIAALILSGLVRLTTGAARSWWPSLIVVALIALGGLYAIEITAI